MGGCFWPYSKAYRSARTLRKSRFRHALKQSQAAPLLRPDLSGGSFPWHRCEEGANALRLQDVIGAFEPLAQPGIQRRLQRAGDLIGMTRRRTPLRQRSEQVGDNRESQGVVQHIEQRGKTRHLREVDLESLVLACLGRERRLAELDTVVG